LNSDRRCRRPARAFRTFAPSPRTCGCARTVRALPQDAWLRSGAAHGAPWCCVPEGVCGAAGRSSQVAYATPARRDEQNYPHCDIETRRNPGAGRKKTKLRKIPPGHPPGPGNEHTGCVRRDRSPFLPSRSLPSPSRTSSPPLSSPPCSFPFPPSLPYPLLGQVPCRGGHRGHELGPRGRAVPGRSGRRMVAPAKGPPVGSLVPRGGTTPDGTPNRHA